MRLSDHSVVSGRRPIGFPLPPPSGSGQSPSALEVIKLIDGSLGLLPTLYKDVWRSPVHDIGRANKPVTENLKHTERLLEESHADSSDSD